MFLLTFLSVFMISVKIGAGVNCSDEIYYQFIDAEEYSLTVVNSNFTLLVVSISETLLPGGDYLYYVMSKSNVTVPPYTDEDIDSNTALDYISVDGDVIVKAKLQKSLRGLVDYGHDGRKTDFDLFLYFQFDSDDFPNVCKLQISHNILDENTQSPNFDQSSYSVELPNNFPLYYPIEGLQVKVYDNDAAPPNNVLSVKSDGCPLIVYDTSYVPQEGSMVPVPVFLIESLDYGYNCTLRVSDGISTAYSFINASVTPTPYQDPVLASEFYTGVLMSVTVGSVVVVQPEISATDPDYPTIPNPTIVYSFTGTDINGAGNYFQMNASTGVVTVKTEIRQDLLQLKAVSFKFTACDVDSQCTMRFLTIKLPYINPSAANSLQFEKRIYSVEVADPVKGDELLQVHVQQQSVIYSFAGDSSDQVFFNIDKNSGIIILTTANPPTKTYTVTVMASNAISDTTSEVNIKISSKISQMVFTSENRVSLTASEWFYNTNTVIYTIKAEEAGAYCLLHVEPAHFQDCFELDKITGDLNVISELDIDNEYKAYGNIIHLRVGAYRDKLTDCNEYNSSYISDTIYKNEVDIEIEVIDFDDYEPMFMDQRRYRADPYGYGYPTDYRLQKIVQKVGTPKVNDSDYTTIGSVYAPDIKYSKYFDMDIPTSAILPIGGGHVPPVSSFYVSLNNSFSATSARTIVNSLGLKYIFTLRMNNINLSEIEERIMDLSREIDLDIYLLYFNVIEKNSDTHLWSIDAHAYSSYGYGFIPFSSVVNSWTYSETNLSEYPREFSDKKYFETESILIYNSKDNAFKTATIILGTILGCICVGVFGIYLLMGLKKYIG
ncbi:UNVERIFIED_CONTAM: hypothetical protein RMT77_003928 [Armadillidium vulgare]